MGKTRRQDSSPMIPGDEYGQSGRRLLQGSKGLTLLEMLCSVLILALFSLMIGSGLNVVTGGYRSSVAQSDMELLSSMLSQRVVEELRYAKEITLMDPVPSDPDVHALLPYRFKSASTGDERYLAVNDQGQLILQPVTAGPEEQKLLLSAAYGKGEYIVKWETTETTWTTVTYDPTTKIFEGKISISQKNGNRTFQGYEFAVLRLVPDP